MKIQSIVSLTKTVDQMAYKPACSVDFHILWTMEWSGYWTFYSENHSCQISLETYHVLCIGAKHFCWPIFFINTTKFDFVSLEIFLTNNLKQKSTQCARTRHIATEDSLCFNQLNEDNDVSDLWHGVFFG